MIFDQKTLNIKHKTSKQHWLLNWAQNWKISIYTFRNSF